MGVRQATWIVALLALTAVLSGCGVSKTLDPVASAATKTEQAGGSKMAMTIDVTTATGQSYEITADGAFDQQEGQMTMDMSSLLQSSGLPAGSGSGIEMRYLTEAGDPVIYMDLPFLDGQLPGGKTWIRIDLEKASKSLGVDLNQLMSQSNQNPAQTLDMLRASGDITTVGPDTINGVATTEYKGTIDLAKAAQLKGVPQALVQKLEDATGASVIPVEVWIGDDGLVRQVRETMDMTTEGQSVSSTTTIDMSDFGTDVSVAAPPPDSVLDLTDEAVNGLQSTTTSTA